MMLTDLATILRSAGLTVVEEAGWKQRGHGAMAAVQTVTCHHTANGGAAGNEPSLNVVLKGRPGLAGPLANLFLAKDGTWHTIAAGVGWHAGVSLALAYTNSRAIGIEAEAKGVPGTFSDWPEVQMASYARGCRALIDHYGLKVADVRGHKETCSPRGRKSDPDFDMAAFRSRVAAVNLKAPIVAASKETDVELTDKIKLTKAAAAAMSLSGTPRKEGDELSVSYLLQWGGAGAYREWADVRAIKAQNVALAAQLKALTAAVNAIAANSPAAIQSAFSAGVTELKAELAKIDVQVTLGDQTDDKE
jgi:hypothetical protein